MDVLGAEALQKLLALLTSLLPDDLDPRPALNLLPLRIAPTGLGGFVGINDAPYGELYGRHIEARLIVTVSAAPAAALDQAVAAVLANFVAADSALLRSQGLIRLALTEIGSPPGAASGALERLLTFSVSYDFVKTPVEEDSGVVRAIHLALKDPADPAPSLHDKRDIETAIFRNQ